MNVVITGASRGIGKAVAEVFARNGYNLYLCSRNSSTMNKVEEELKESFSNIQIHSTTHDLANKEEAKAFGNWITSKTQSIDVLVNNVGTFVQGNVSDEPDGALEHMLGVNLYSAYHTTRALLPSMLAQKRGHIFTICSIASLQAYANGGAYSISKYALLGFTKNLRQELRPHNIKVTAIIPGAVYTDSWIGSGVPQSRIMEATDIAKLIYSTSHLSPQATVEEIVVRPQLGDL
ncbi:MAG TPA: SDR family oxidoreductase [Chitinophagaceae bacterium]|nr:SDR family oxidoreductase [Chitinophagaceae bacterium]